MLNKIKKLFAKEQAPEQPVDQMLVEQTAAKPARKPRKPRKPREPKTETLSAKEQATKNNQPWHDIKLVTNPEDPRNGYYQMDWNDQHILELRKAGYTGNTDEDVIEEWIRDICRTVAMENEEILDYMARPRVQSKKNDDGLTEYS